ncbi:unnamed protein product [Rhizoctonia solani]|uniref:Inhibitor I9 domain-containing protein n=1 Tax=Rhizoctonia solani TaxID=456999 RepID=A0A8H2X3Z8_9AGAM|nr:unnamed protein product [Rhizoctonia solani]
MSGAKRYIFTFKEGTSEDSPQAKKAKEFILNQGTYSSFGRSCSSTYSHLQANFASNDLSDAVESVEADGVVTTQ